jgi:hypothetical protein
VKRLLFTLLSALLAVFTLGCPGNSGTDGGVDGGEVDPPSVEITVSGTTYVYPLAAAFLTDAGLPAVGLAGLTLRMEEPLKVALKDPTGILGSQTLTSAGTFSFAKVPMDLVNLGLAAGVRDDSDAGTPRVIRSATTLYDVALQGKKPDTDQVGQKAWAVPVPFHDKLTAAVTPAKVAAVTALKNPKTTLVEAGFILGQIVDSTGAPVANATLTTSPAALANQVVYPTADFSTTQAATSSNGLFIFIHDGDQQPVTFSFVVKDKPEYLSRKGGAALDACLLITVYPGKVAP